MPDPISWAFSGPYFLAALALGYLLGSVPFGLVLTRLAGTPDIRAIGSGSIGATNVLRTGRKDLAVATMLLDALKGTAAVLIAARWGGEMAVIAGLGAFLGHLFPVWLKFNGGKGVATFIGVILGLWWPGVLIFAVCWMSVAFVSRYSSLAALVAAVVTPLARLALDFQPELPLGMALARITPLAQVLVVMAVLLIIRHRSNIARLRAGTEGKIGQEG